MKRKYAPSWVATRSVSSENTCRNEILNFRNRLKVYDSVMKFVLLAIFVLFAAQPLQASPCDMCDGQSSGHSQHGDMLDGDMDHGDMDMDCCDHDPTDSSDGCGSMSHCGACTAGLTAISPSAYRAFFNSGSLQFPMVTNKSLSRYSSPPFRPPIV